MPSMPPLVKEENVGRGARGNLYCILSFLFPLLVQPMHANYIQELKEADISKPGLIVLRGKVERNWETPCTHYGVTCTYIA